MSIFLFGAVFTNISHAQDITVKPIPSLDKLPVNAIHRIFQDNEGYMWYGTFNGLCRYDGYNIRTFRSDLFNPGLLADNYITYIAEDKDKKIWFGTLKGAYILDKRTYSITPVDLGEFSDRNVYSINVTKDGTIWISVPGKLFLFNPDGSLVRQYDTEFNGAHQSVYRVYEDKSGNLLISVTNSGMYKLNKEDDLFEPYCHNSFYKDITKIIWDEVHDCYWLGTWGKGIICFDPQQKDPEKIYTPQPLPVDMLGNPAGNLYHMEQDDVFHYLWVTTERNLCAFRITDQKTLEQIDTSSFLSPNNKVLYEIYKDKDGKLWVSAFDEPSFIIDIRKYTVKEYPLPALRERLKINPALSSLCVDKKGIFWLSQDRYGLCIYDRQAENLKLYTDCKETRHLPLWGMIELITSPSHDCVWGITTNNSTVYQLKYENRDIKAGLQLRIKDVTSQPGYATTLFEDNNSILWIGTTIGLFAYNISKGTLETISDSLGHVSGITQTMDGRVWAVVKNKGICEIDARQEAQMHHYDKDFLYVDATSDGTLWLGTGEGEVLVFDPDKKELIDESLACSMNGDIINNITVDIYNHIWITTNHIIKEYNPRNRAYRIYNTHNHNFLMDRLLPHAVSYDGKENIYFGGVSGIVSIPPSQQLESIPEQVVTHITDIKIMGDSNRKERLVEDMRHHSIQIPPDGQNLEIEFSSLDYHNLDQVRYAYRMIGIDKDWVYLDAGKNVAFYNKLNKGNYTFQVKATDKNGLWSDRITEMTVRRLPAPYETWWAYSLYILTVAAVLGVILFLYLQKQKEENDKKILEKVTQMKLRYFTNISHELLTPLTILSCLSEDIESPLDADKNRVCMIQSNINRLKRLLQQVLDFRKVESRSMKLYVSYGDIVSFVRSICRDSFVQLMERKNIAFTFVSEPEKIGGYFDHDKLDKILFNLLSNAFKYTPEGKSVSLKLEMTASSDHKNLIIKIKDEGKGIAPNEMDRIFTCFYNNKLNEQSLSNGIGLSLTKELVELHHGTISVKSEFGKGAEFTIQIPVDKNSYTVEELKEITTEYTQNINIPAEEKKEEISEESSSSEYTLLLVEDNTELLTLLESVFRKTYRVLKAENGKEALGFIHSNNIDIVISDIMMPEMDGLELCRHIKHDINTSHIIVILLTAQNNAESQIDSYETGADDYMPKPFQLSVLKARIQNLLNKRKEIQEQFKHNPHLDLIAHSAFTSLDEQLIEKAFKIVEDNLGDSDFDISKLAALLNITRVSLSRKIKAITGQTALEFIRAIKMKHACRMLENPNVSVAEVIIALGYSDHKHFTTIFKETFGVTPSEYQKRYNSHN